MTPTLTFEFTPAAKATLARFEQLPRRVLVGIARGLDKANQLTVGVIQRDFMSFPKSSPPTMEGLRVITNRLRGSVRASKAVIAGDTVTSSIGSNVKYAALHEFGGVITVTKKPGTVRLRTDARGNLLRQGPNGRLAIFAKNVHKRAKEVAFGGSTYTATYPARRPFLRGINRTRETTIDIVSRAAIAAANEK